jgi:hypothetical protein
MTRGLAKRDFLPRHVRSPFVNALVMALAVLVGLAASAGTSRAQVRVVIATGLGGDPKYSASFAKNGERLDAALRAKFGVADSDVYWFGEDSALKSPRYRGQATKANLERVLGTLADQGNVGTSTVIILIGHGAGDGADTKISLPGPDLTAADFQRLLARFGAQRVAFVNLTSASGEMLGVLAAPGRVVITATKSSFERNESHFGDYFVDALANGGADLDKDGRISLLEAYLYANRETKRFYETDSKIQTEHPQLDDDGDKVGTAEPSSKTTDGFLARRFFLDPGPRGRVVTDTRLNALYKERFALEDAVDELKRRKATTSADAYEAEMAQALIALARKSHEIRAIEGAP